MRGTRFGGHLLVYYNSLRGKGAHEPEDLELGASLGCPVFVINLERSSRRREFMLNYLASYRVDVRVFPAVDGSELDTEELKRRGVYDDRLAHERFSRSLSPTEIATTLSHLGVCRTMVEEDIPMAMVLEDDAMFCPASVKRIGAALREAPSDWDVLQLHHDCMEFAAVTENVFRFPATTRMPVGAAGYLMRVSGARKMLANGFPICYPADSLMGRSPRWGVVLYGLVPPVVIQNSAFPSQISVTKNWLSRLKYSLKGIAVSVLGGVAKRLG